MHDVINVKKHTQNEYLSFGELKDIFDCAEIYEKEN